MGRNSKGSQGKGSANLLIKYEGTESGSRLGLGLGAVS